jgi:RHS repeat-associated protein
MKRHRHRGMKLIGLIIVFAQLSTALFSKAAYSKVYDLPHDTDSFFQDTALESLYQNEADQPSLLPAYLLAPGAASSLDAARQRRSTFGLEDAFKGSAPSAPAAPFMAAAIFGQQRQAARPGQGPAGESASPQPAAASNLVRMYLPLVRFETGVSAIISPLQGGILTTSDGVRITFAPGAVADMAVATYRPTTVKNVPLNIRALGAAFDLTAVAQASDAPLNSFMPQVSQAKVLNKEFNAWQTVYSVTPTVQITIQYDPAKTAGLSESSLRLYRQDKTTRTWNVLPSSADPATHRVQATVEASGRYAVFGRPLPQTLSIGPVAGVFSTTPLTGAPVVVLDPDHGGSDPGGTVSSPQAFVASEKTYNLQVAQLVRDRLVACGIQVEMTRSADDSVSLISRAGIINATNPAAAVTLAFNIVNHSMSMYGTGSGPEGWVDYGKSSDRSFSANINTRVSQYTAGLLPDTRGVRDANAWYGGALYVPTHVTPLYSQSELAFMDSYNDRAVMDDSVGMGKIADGVFMGIIDALGGESACAAGPGEFQFPEPLSAADRERLRNLGYQNYMRYRGDPVNTSTGNAIHQPIDLAVPGVGGLDLVFQRTYNSLDDRDGRFGFGWTSLLDMSLRFARDGSVDVRYQDGSGVYFTTNGDGFTVSQGGVFDQLVRNGDSFVLIGLDQTSYHFELIGYEGRLTKIVDRRGNTILFHRTDQGVVDRITDSAGREYNLNYQDGHVTSISGVAGHAIQYAYDGNSDLRTVTDANGNIYRYEYDDGHHLSKTIDPENITYNQNIYDDQGRIVEQIDANGEHYFFENNQDGRTVSRDGANHSTIDSYDSSHRVVETIDADSKSEKFSYDENNNVTLFTDKRGNTWRYSYDDRGNILAVTDPLGNITSYAYSELNDLVRVTDSGGPGKTLRTTTYTYDDNGNLTRVGYPDGTAVCATYNDRGQLVSRTDENLHTTRYTYDQQGNLISQADALTFVTSYDYDSVGRRVAVTDANGHSMRFAYDANNNVTSITDARGKSTLLSYDKNNSLVQKIDRRAGVTRYEYNVNLNLSAETDPMGHTRRYEYDSVNNLLRSVDALGHATSYRYDSLYRLIEVAAPLGGITRYEYDANGNTISTTDAVSATTRLEYDALNRLTKRTDPLGGVASFEYDSVGRSIATVTPRLARTEHEYDLRDRIILSRDALQGETRFSYDAAGNMLVSVDPNNHTINLRYDAGNRLTGRWDAGGHATLFSYDKVGNTVAITDALNGLTRYTFDLNDNLVATTDALSGVTRFAYDDENTLTRSTDANGHMTTFAYDLDGMLKVLTEAGGQQTFFEYDAMHQLTKRTNAKGNAWIYGYDALNRKITDTDPLGNTTRYAYDAIGHRTRVIDANGIATGYRYDVLGRLTSVLQNEQLSAPPNQQTNVMTQYQYDADGNQTRIIDANGEISDFEYDALNRLTREINPLGNEWHYQYDPAGNLIARRDAKGQVTRYAYDSDNLLSTIGYPNGTGVRFTYDAAHNQIGMIDSLGATTNRYDALNRLASSTNHVGQTVTYTYDPVGNRTSMGYPDGRKLRFDYDATNFEARIVDPDGHEFTITRDLTHNAVGIDNPNQTTARYAFDAAERLTSIDNRHANGDLLNSFAYTLDPVGNRREASADYASGRPRTLTTRYEYDPLYRLTRSEDSEQHFNDYTFDPVGNRTSLTTNFDPTTSRTIDEMTTQYTYDGANELISSINSVTPRGAADRSEQTGQMLQAFVHEVKAQRGRHITVDAAAALEAQAQTLLASLADRRPPATDVETGLAELAAAVNGAAAQGAIDNAGIQNSLLAKLNGATDANRNHGGERAVTLYDYDMNGNRVRQTMPNEQTGSSGDWLKTEYAYDFENRLTHVQHFQTPNLTNWLPKDETILSYDGYGRLFRRLHDQHSGRGGQKWNDYVYDGLTPIAEYVEPSPQYTNLYRGLGRILSAHDFKSQQSPKGTLYYYHYDGLGSVSALTKQHGQSDHDFRYGDYGTILDNNGHAADASNFSDPHAHYTYTGQEWDEQTELLHFYAREYDPSTGTWLQQDPYREDVKHGNSNRYQYVSDNPINQIDVLGYKGCKVNLETDDCLTNLSILLTVMNWWELRGYTLAPALMDHFLWDDGQQVWINPEYLWNDSGAMNKRKNIWQQIAKTVGSLKFNFSGSRFLEYKFQTNSDDDMPSGDLYYAMGHFSLQAKAAVAMHNYLSSNSLYQRFSMLVRFYVDDWYDFKKGYATGLAQTAINAAVWMEEHGYATEFGMSTDWYEYISQEVYITWEIDEPAPSSDLVADALSRVSDQTGARRTKR